MPKPQSVDAFLEALTHGRKREIERLRGLILAAAPGVTEQVKWNAPSFGIAGDDRVTMRLQPGDRLQIILHRGAKVRDANGFSFDDPSGLVRWLARDRGEVSIADAVELDARAEAIADLVGRWMQETRD